MKNPNSATSQAASQAVIEPISTVPTAAQDMARLDAALVADRWPKAYDAWVAAMKAAHRNALLAQLKIGRGLIWGEIKFGQEYAAIADVLNVQPGTLMSWKFVASRFSDEDVIGMDVSWSVLRQIATEEDTGKRTALVKAASENGWTADEAAAAAKGITIEQARQIRLFQQVVATWDRLLPETRQAAIKYFTDNP